MKQKHEILAQLTKGLADGEVPELHPDMQIPSERKWKNGPTHYLIVSVGTLSYFHVWTDKRYLKVPTSFRVMDLVNEQLIDQIWKLVKRHWEK